MFQDMFLEPLVLESATLKRLRALRIHPNPVAAAWHVAAQLEVVAGGDPGAPNREVNCLRFAEDAVAMGGLGQGFAEIPVVQSVIDVRSPPPQSPPARPKLVPSSIPQHRGERKT